MVETEGRSSVDSSNGQPLTFNHLYPLIINSFGGSLKSVLDKPKVSQALEAQDVLDR